MPILSVDLGSVGTWAELAAALGVPVPAIDAVSLEKTVCRRAQCSLAAATAVRTLGAAGAAGRNRPAERICRRRQITIRRGRELLANGQRHVRHQRAEDGRTGGNPPPG